MRSIFSRLNFSHLKVNSLPNDKIFDWSKLKAFANDKINVNEKLKFGLGRVENIVGKGEMLITSIFSFSHNIFLTITLPHLLHSFKDPVRKYDFPTILPTRPKTEVILLLANALNLVQFKIFSFGKGLTLYHTISTCKDPAIEAF